MRKVRNFEMVRSAWKRDFSSANFFSKVSKIFPIRHIAFIFFTQTCLHSYIRPMKNLKGSWQNLRKIFRKNITPPDRDLRGIYKYITYLTRVYSTCYWGPPCSITGKPRRQLGHYPKFGHPIVPFHRLDYKGIADNLRTPAPWWDEPESQVSLKDMNWFQIKLLLWLLLCQWLYTVTNTFWRYFESPANFIHLRFHS